MSFDTARNADMLMEDQGAAAQVGDLVPSSAEFHRRRAEAEMDRALVAGTLTVAMRHLELARLHRERRSAIASAAATTIAAARCDRTDKEG